MASASSAKGKGRAQDDYEDLEMARGSMALGGEVGDDGMRAEDDAPEVDPSKKTRKQKQNRVAQRRFRGRQAEYVKQLESELAMVKADPSWREDAKDAWIKRLQEDNRQLKQFILGTHRVIIPQNIDTLLRTSYEVSSEGKVVPIVSSSITGDGDSPGPVEREPAPATATGSRRRAPTAQSEAPTGSSADGTEWWRGLRDDPSANGTNFLAGALSVPPMGGPVPAGQSHGMDATGSAGPGASAPNDPFRRSSAPYVPSAAASDIHSSPQQSPSPGANPYLSLSGATMSAGSHSGQAVINPMVALSMNRPLYITPGQLYQHAEVLGHMTRQVFGDDTDFSAPHFSYLDFSDALEPISNFGLSWMRATFPNEPEQEVAAFAWIMFLFANKSVNPNLVLPSFLRPTRLQQDLPHEPGIASIPWPELRDQLILHDGNMTFRIIGELLNCMSLQFGKYNPQRFEKPNQELGELRLVRELTYWGDGRIHFDELVNINNWRLSRDAPERIPSLHFSEMVLEPYPGQRRRKESDWNALRASSGN